MYGSRRCCDNCTRENLRIAVAMSVSGTEAMRAWRSNFLNIAEVACGSASLLSAHTLIAFNFQNIFSFKKQACFAVKFQQTYAFRIRLTHTNASNVFHNVVAPDFDGFVKRTRKQQPSMGYVNDVTHQVRVAAKRHRRLRTHSHAHTHTQSHYQNSMRFTQHQSRTHARVCHVHCCTMLNNRISCT